MTVDSMPMREIARLSGVSRATVSAVLNGKPGVTEKTRRKVLDTIRRHKLHTGLMARSLMGHFSTVYGVVVPDINNPFYTELFDGFLGVMKACGNHMICQPVSGHDDEVRTLETLMGYDLGGYVLVPAQEHDSVDHIRTLVDAGKPVVTIGQFESVGSHTVLVDDRGGCRAATDHLIRSGHRRIVCLSGNPMSTIAKERTLGFVESLLDHGLPFNDSMIIPTDGHFSTGYQRAMDVLGPHRDRPTALVCFNDVVAIGAYRAAHELGLQIPEDVSVVGFDDIDIASELGPPLTSVAMHGREIGKAAAEILLTATEDANRNQVLSRTIVGALIARGSVRELPAG